MYINFKLAKEKGLSVSHVVALQMIKQNKFEDLSKDIETYVGLDLQWFEDHGFVEYIKAKNKKQSKFELIRLSKKGGDLLDTLETPEVCEHDLTVYDWLAKEYTARDKPLGNRKKGKLWLALFRAHSGIEKNALVKLCMDYINDEEAQKWSLQLDYVFFKPPNIHSVRFDIEESKLWRFYLKNQEHYDNLFKQEKYLR